MRRIIICLLALFISVAVSAQISKKKTKSVPPPVKSDTSAVKKDSAATDQKASDDGAKFDYKKANAKAAEEDNEEPAPAPKPGSGSTTQPDSNSGSTTPKSTSASASKSAYGSKTAQKPKSAAKPKPMTAAEKKADEEAAEIEAATPKGVEALFYKFPVEYLPVVKEFLDYKQSESPHAKIKDDITTRKQIIRFKDIDRGYMMLQKPGDNKYTKLQIYKMNNGNVVMAVEQSNCMNAMCSGTLQFYTKSAGGWKDATEEYYPQIDYKFVIDRLKSAYKKQYKDLELYNAQNYEDNDVNLKKAITYQISPDDGSIVIQEQNLPAKLYSMTWDPKKEKFILKKVDK